MAAGAAGPAMSFFPNPDLWPETTTGWEIGSNFRKYDVFTGNDRLSVKVNHFRNEVKDYVTAMIGQGVYFGNNPGESVVEGFELEGGYDAGRVFASISYSDTDS